MDRIEVLDAEIRIVLHGMVATGITWLNEAHPHWLGEMNVDNLRMQNECRCVIGQLEGNYFRYVNESEISRSVMIDRGFEFEEAKVLPQLPPVDGWDRNGIHDYLALKGWDMLTEIWKERIYDLKQVAPKAVSLEELRAMLA